MMNILEEIHDIKGQFTAIYYAMQPEADEEFRRMGCKSADVVMEKLKAIEKYLMDTNNPAEITSAVVEVCGVPVFGYGIKED